MAKPSVTPDPDTGQRGDAPLAPALRKTETARVLADKAYDSQCIRTVIC